MRQGRVWSDEELELLEDGWGTFSIKTIAENLNRTSEAVKLRAVRLGLGAYLDNGDYVTFNQLLKAIGKSSYSYTVESWIKKRGLPVRKKKVNKCTFRVIYIDDFWKWAEKNRHFINWSKFHPLSLGEEPAWVAQQRTLSEKTEIRFKKTPWTKYEDSRLEAMLKEKKYTVDELSSLLGRTVGAIQRRRFDLQIPEKPVRANNQNFWTENEYQKLKEMIQEGFTYELMSEELNRSSKAIRGKVFVFYQTENLDKVRKFILENQKENKEDKL